MNLSAPFIFRPVMTTLLSIALIIMGIFAFNKLPVSNLPDVNYPVIGVSVPFPGANPEIMAHTIAVPLEKQFMTIPGIRYVTSSNTLGFSSIILEFDLNKDIDLAAVDVETAIRAARPQLPPNLPQDPTFKKANPSASPIQYIAVTSPTMSKGELFDYATTFIGQRISIIEGVSQVIVYGFASAVRAQVDPGVLGSLGLTFQGVADSIFKGNQYQPLGQFDGHHIAEIIYDNGALLKAEDYDPLIVAYRNGAPIRLGSLGKVVDSVQVDRGDQRFIDEKLNQPAVILAVQQLPRANAVKVADAVRDLLANMKGQLPGAVELKMIFDRSDSIRASIHDVELTLVAAFLLVVLVIFIYLGKPQDTLIPALAMPMSIIGTFTAIYLLGYNLDNLSLLALTLSIGFIIDDAIVVLENIVRHIEEGEPPFQASLEGSKQINFTIVSMTLSLIAVFIPLVFMPGLVGRLFREFSVTLTVVTLISGIISLTLTPMLCSRFLHSQEKRLANSKGIAALSVRFNAWMLGYYKKGLLWVLAHRKITLFVGGLSVILSAILFTILPTDFLPEDDIGFIVAYTEAEQGTSSDQMSTYHMQLVDLLKHDPSINSMVSLSSTPEYRQGMILIDLVPKNKRKSSLELIQGWNKALKVLGLNIYMVNIPLIDLNIGPQNRGAYQFLMQSLNTQALYQAAESLLQRLRKDETFQAVSTDMEITTPQINMDIQRNQSYALGVNVENFEEVFSLSYSGNRISRIQTPINQYDVILEIDRDRQRNPSSLYSLYLQSQTNNQFVPVRAVSNWTEGVGPASVNHYAQFPAVTIAFNVKPNVPLSEALQSLRAHAAQSFSDNVSGEFVGAAQSFETSIKHISVLLIITVFTIYIVLGILYESFIHPLTILSTLPPAILGGLLVLYLTSTPLSIYAYLGIILLIGIVKKNGIMMVDFALDNIRIKGESAEKSIFDASLVRFRPIMMTTAAAIIGAVPIALGIGTGADSRRPLGYVIIGGMCISQLITLFVTPVIYLYLERIREKFSSKKTEKS